MTRRLFPVAGGSRQSIVAAAASEARVVRFVVEQRRPVLDGKNFGDAGPYERIDGTVYFEIDPREPLNAQIVNLDKAPRTPSGMVGFSSPFYILKPVDMARGNRKIFYGVNNRGNKLDYAGERSCRPAPTTTIRSPRPTSATPCSCGSATPMSTPGGRATSPPATAGSCRVCRSPPADARRSSPSFRVEFADVDGFTRSLEGSAVMSRAPPTRPPI